MKYYCKTCESELFIGKDVDVTEYVYDGLYCPISRGHGQMTNVPDWETPRHYRERTGKPYSNNGLVFYRHVFDGETGRWELGAYAHTVRYCADEEVDDIVIADPPVQPPDDWRRE